LFASFGGGLFYLKSNEICPTRNQASKELFRLKSPIHNLFDIGWRKMFSSPGFVGSKCVRPAGRLFNCCVTTAHDGIYNYWSEHANLETMSPVWQHCLTKLSIMVNLFSWGAKAQPRRRSGMIFTGYILITALLALCACDSQHPMPDYDTQAAWKTLGLGVSQEAFDQSLGSLADVVLDPPPEWGKDYNPTFPADIPFNAEEWLTNDPGPSVAVPDAPKGGVLRLSIPSYPPTIRTEGPNSRLATLSTIHSLIYETLMGYDHTIGDYVPGLASHWQVDDDRQTFRFRINPKARWADGRPVTADDVAATFEHYTNPERRFRPSIASFMKPSWGMITPSAIMFRGSHLTGRWTTIAKPFVFVSTPRPAGPMVAL
jgi:hypothetical protein